ncbi:MDR family oxidoreductase [uncultured Paraglaciecola sp.]|uniref:acrylyl-CoA reductase (NADPH) n=1 Tax=uncultured Paraglaciecola sp. TaxID=1765024 RepID=UPI002598FF9D|nr:MDR family oxidoreductase [uncultured Paraglaciecola sp.]
MFKGILIEKNNEQYTASVRPIDDSQLPEGDVTIDVSYSTLNYKDGLAITGKAPIVKNFPMVPGIDLVGTVTKSDNSRFVAGDKVLLNGFGVGETHWGGLAEKARLHSDWLLKLPTGLSAKQAMTIGTAGYTAMLSVIALERHGITPEKGDVLVTGANGGVGSFAVTLLSKLGYRVIASTGRPEEGEYLEALGAAEIINRNTLSDAGRPMGKERWIAAVDSVGSHTLANICAGLKYGGIVTACGLAQGMDFPASVAPFILRGVTLVGIDSVYRPIADREEAWARLANLLTDEDLGSIGTEIGLDKVVTTAEDLIAGKIRGRIMVNLQH